MKYKGIQMNQNDSAKWSILKLSCYDNIIKIHDFMWFNKNIEAKPFICKKLPSELVFCTKPKQLFPLLTFFSEYLTS